MVKIMVRFVKFYFNLKCFQIVDFELVADEINRRTKFRTMHDKIENGVSDKPIILEIFSPNVITLQVPLILSHKNIIFMVL